MSCKLHEGHNTTCQRHSHSHCSVVKFIKTDVNEGAFTMNIQQAHKEAAEPKTVSLPSIKKKEEQNDVRK